MVNCWASGLGDCSTKQSKEHYYSKAILGGSPVTVKGLPWCISAKTIPAEGFARNILCAKHNSALSQLDTAGSDAMETLSRFTQVASVRQVQRRTQNQIVRGNVDGYLLERWLLKFLIGLAFEHSTPTGEMWRPPESWVKVCFGRKPFEEGCGLYVGRLAPAHEVVRQNRVSAQTITRGSGQIDGVLFDLNGLQLLLTVSPMEEQLPDYRPNFLYDRQDDTTWQVVRISWCEPGEQLREDDGTHTE